MTCSFQPIPIRFPIRTYLLLRGVFRLEALNCGELSQGDETLPSPAIAAHLKHTINRLAGNGLDLATGRIDYARLSSSPAFEEYLQATRTLQYFDLHTLTTDATRRAFWLNLYNALVVHAVIAYRPPHSINDLPGIFDRAAYSVGGYRFSANDIEHGILRANAGHPLLPGPQFGRNDPRRAFCLAHLDPRIHFALVCAARSCPPIAIYDAERLDTQLDLAARNFVNNGSVILDRQRLQVRLSRVFSWFAADFGGRWFYGHLHRVLSTLAPYLESPTDRAFVQENAHKLRVKFLPYDWSLNV